MDCIAPASFAHTRTAPHPPPLAPEYRGEGRRLVSVSTSAGETRWAVKLRFDIAILAGFAQQRSHGVEVTGGEARLFEIVARQDLGIGWRRGAPARTATGSLLIH